MEGVLGGYGCVNEVDVRGSDAFLRSLLPERFGAEKRHLVALGSFSLDFDILLGPFRVTSFVNSTRFFLRLRVIVASIGVVARQMTTDV